MLCSISLKNDVFTATIDAFASQSKQLMMVDKDDKLAKGIGVIFVPHEVIV
jgi:hypothetical protein